MKEPPAPPEIERIEAGDLRDNDRLGELYVQAVARRYWPNSAAAMLEFAALAEKALADDVEGTPGKLFYALVERKDSATVTQAAETRAMLRFPSHRRQDIVEAAGERRAKAIVPAAANLAEIRDTLADREIGYAHAVLMQCFLPQRPTRQTRWRTSHGRASLSVEAGSLANPARPNEWLDCAVPSGPKPRLITRKSL